LAPPTVVIPNPVARPWRTVVRNLLFAAQKANSRFLVARQGRDSSE
jgi:hypothetical protein